LPPPTLFFCRLLTHIAAHLFFVNKKIKELQANTPSRKKSPTHRRKLNNIMCVIVFFSPAYIRRKADYALKKSYNNIILNSQQRSNKKNNPTPSSHANYFFYCAVKNPRFLTAVW
jgi:hypothetical protein